MNCVETSNLVFRFSKNEIVLNDINLAVGQGTIYGFLGPNGAGKTTTLKLILGLLTKQQGEILVFGKPFHENRLEILGKLGSLIESPSLYGHLTARDNLRVLQAIYRCPKSRIDEVLSMVGLPATGTKKVYQFSLGMKQRLSIAIALLHSPSLLILDEPTNGLDPNGIIEMRELLKRLNREHGITVLVSSHLLAEIEKLVTHVGIIHKGKMMFQGTLDDLINKQQETGVIAFETSDSKQTARLLQLHQYASQVKNGKVEVAGLSRDEVARINQELVGSGVHVYGITSVRNDLEMIFMDLINE
jgi:ABC-type multidrug transport system ATPase subunit